MIGVDAGWALFAETLASQAVRPLVDGVAIMTTDMDPLAVCQAR